jgi:glucose/arabinose dehydrogenase
MRTLLTVVALVAATVLACGSAGGRDMSSPGYVLRAVPRGLAQPLYVTVAPGEANRLYVVLRGGTVRVLERGRLRPGFFLDIRGRVQAYGEMGLLSIAFHPGYAENGLVYAAFNDQGLERPVTIVEYHVRDRRVDPATERVLVRVPHEDSPYHNGGQLQFGPDGWLYAGVGDGGYLNGPAGLIPDPRGNAQNLDVLLGKIFRLDVGTASPAPELVAYGARNPWRFSFGPGGDLIVGDVGWNTSEEVDVIPAASGLVNLGWNVYEGPASGPTEARSTRPVAFSGRRSRTQRG